MSDAPMKDPQLEVSAMKPCPFYQSGGGLKLQETPAMSVMHYTITHWCDVLRGKLYSPIMITVRGLSLAEAVALWNREPLEATS